MKILSFGDSWTAGWGLKKHEKNFTEHLSKYFRCTSQNFGISGSSLGHILHTFSKEIFIAKKTDLIVVIVPPDTRWYTEAGDNQVRSLMSNESAYKNFVKDKTTYWFKYHHCLFIHSMYSICMQKNLNAIFAHNYGNLDLVKPFNKLVPNNVFLDKKQSLTKLLEGQDYDNYSLEHDGPPESGGNDNFIPGDTHPSEQGHRIIAKMLLKKYNEDLQRVE